MDKTVIITGAAGNLGTATVTKFLESGYNIVGTVEPGKEGKHLPDHPNLELKFVDATNEVDAEEFVQTVARESERLEAVLILVGGFAMGGIEETGIKELHDMYSLNFMTAYNIARPSFDLMTKQQEGGRIIFIGARPALEASSGKTLVAYALSKSLIFKLAELLNEAGKEKNVVATVIVPSIIDTPQNRGAMPNANFDDWVSPHDIADMMVSVVEGSGRVLREPVLKVYGNG